MRRESLLTIIAIIAVLLSVEPTGNSNIPGQKGEDFICALRGTTPFCWKAREPNGTVRAGDSFSCRISEEKVICRKKGVRDV